MTRPRITARLGIGLAPALAVAGCGSGGGSSEPAAPTTVAVAPGDPACIENETGDGCVPVRPASQRVDLGQPSFPDPTNVSNPRRRSSRPATESSRRGLRRSTSATASPWPCRPTRSPVLRRAGSSILSSGAGAVPALRAALAGTQPSG
jgi:hypothetical protein